MTDARLSLPRTNLFPATKLSRCQCSPASERTTAVSCRRIPSALLRCHKPRKPRRKAQHYTPTHQLPHLLHCFPRRQSRLTPSTTLLPDTYSWQRGTATRLCIRTDTTCSSWITMVILLIPRE